MRSDSHLRAYILLGALLCSAPAQARAQAPAESQEPLAQTPVTVRVELVADSLRADTRAQVEVELAQRLAARASELGFSVADSDAAVLVLRVEFGQPDHQSPVYVVHAVAFYDGQLLERADARTCFRCTAGELVDNGLELLPNAIAGVEAARPMRVDEPPPPIVEPNAVEQGGPPKPKPGPVSYSGLVIGALGLASAITGAVLLARGTQPHASDPHHLTVLDYERPGAALLGLGLTAMVASTTMLALDMYVLAPRRASKPRAGLSRIMVTASGLVLTGRF